MTEDNQDRGNPEPIGASSDFFEALEDNVNSAIKDNNITGSGIGGGVEVAQNSSNALIKNNIITITCCGSF